MILVDTHTHLYLEQFDEDRDEVVKAAIADGVVYMLLPRIDTESHEVQMALSKKYPENCLSMMGLHPTSVKDDYKNELEVVEEELKKGIYIGVGEIGIDLYWDDTFKKEQEYVFRRQLQLAKEYKLPVSIHTRDSFEEVYRIVKEEHNEDLKGVFHCFTGTPEEAKMIMDLGFSMGIGGILTFKNSGLAEVVKDIPMEYLVLETDSPFLTPVPYRGKRNQSKYIVHIAQKLAEIKKTTIEQVAETTTANATELFKLKI
jgi:TatD DNase family protein